MSLNQGNHLQNAFEEDGTTPSAQGSGSISTCYSVNDTISAAQPWDENADLEQASGHDWYVLPMDTTGDGRGIQIKNAVWNDGLTITIAGQTVNLKDIINYYL